MLGRAEERLKKQRLDTGQIVTPTSGAAEALDEIGNDIDAKAVAKLGAQRVSPRGCDLSLVLSVTRIRW